MKLLDRKLLSIKYPNIDDNTEIEMDSMDLQKLDEIVFKGLIRLTRIELQMNKIEVLQKDIFSGLVNLTHINLSINELKDLNEETFSELKNLKLINLSENSLTSLGQKTFSGLKKLEKIYLHNNKFGENSLQLILEPSVLFVSFKSEQKNNRPSNDIALAKIVAENSQSGLIYSNRSDKDFRSNTKYKFTILLRIHPLKDNLNNVFIRCKDLKFRFDETGINLTNNQEILQQKNLIPNISFNYLKKYESIIWISLSSRDHYNFNEDFLKIGHGSLMESNTLAHFTARSEEGFKELRTINIDDVVFDSNGVDVIERICLIDPFIKDFHPLVFESERSQVSISELDQTRVSIYSLPIEAVSLYDKIKNVYMPKIVYDAIEYSIQNEGLTLNKKLKQKAGTFGDLKTTYIRIPLGVNYGNQPGQPFVLEIWPKGHNSPVHNHGNATALIKILYGKITAEIYNPLTDENNPSDPKAIKTCYLKYGEITWMTSLHFQTHKLINESNSTAVSIQCYAHSHSNSDEEFQETFNYILPNDNELHHFIPNKDYSYDELEVLVLKEYENVDSAKAVPTIDKNILWAKYKKFGNGEFGDLLKSDSLADNYKIESSTEANKFFTLKRVREKVTNKEEFFKTKGYREAKLVSLLPSNGFLVRHEESFFDETNHFFLVIEFFEGGDLRSRINEKKSENSKFTFEVLKKWSKEIILALDFLHSNNVIHRDLRPENIQLTRSGQIKVSDLSGAIDYQKSIANTVNNMADYSSPEMIKFERYTNLTDIWSAGVIIFELIDLKRPFIIKDNRPIQRVIREDPVPELSNETPDSLRLLIKMMLQKKPESRMPASELKTFIDSLSSMANFLRNAS